jgi:hypothetical protein
MYFMQDDRRIFKSTADLQPADIRSLYDGFHSAIADLDCGKKCAPHNPSGKPFCCDICQALPAAYERMEVSRTEDGAECEQTTPAALWLLRGNSMPKWSES